MQSFIVKYMGIGDPNPFKEPDFEKQFLGISTYKPRRSGMKEAYLEQLEMYKSSVFGTIGIGPFARFEKQKTQKKPEKKVERERPAFKICAPQQDFHTSGYVLKEGYILVYDPVVLQPVKNGYLIVSAWGLEASDEIVVNETHN